MRQRDVFAVLRRSRRIWAVAAIRGEAARLAALHGRLAEAWQAGDRIVYLGDMLGRGSAVIATVDELLRFRRLLLAQPGVHACDIVFLRGSQEEMWQKLMQIHFAPNPLEVMEWMFRHGVDATLRAYGHVPERALAVAREGNVALSRFTAGLKAAVQATPGHHQLMASLRRAAYTDDGGLVLVNVGIDPDRPLSEQTDSFWWGAADFARISEPYGGSAKVVRGADPARAGLAVGPFTVSLDAGCGEGGPLLAACLTPEGTVADLLEG